jgi:hypothetical protein
MWDTARRAVKLQSKHAHRYFPRPVVIAPAGLRWAAAVEEHARHAVVAAAETCIGWWNWKQVLRLGRYQDHAPRRQSCHED